MMTDYDLVIVGGGMVGATLADGLAQSLPELRIAVIEQAPPQQAQSPSFDSRAIALGYGSVEYLQLTGLWSAMSQYAQPIADIHVSDQGFAAKVRMHAAEQNIDALGYVIEVADMGQVLTSRLPQYANLTLLQPLSVSAIETRQDDIQLTLSDAQQISARLVLGCDGAGSQVRQLAGIAQQSESYQQHAVISTVQTDAEHNNAAFERFTQSGPLALLPLPDNRLSLVWTVEEDNSAGILALDDEAFLGELQQRFGYQLGRFIKVGKRACYPLQLIQTPELIRHRLALVGNACHTIHPIAGQGFNLGLRDIACLHMLIVDAVQQHQDIGAVSLLLDYQQRRRDDQAQTIGMTDALVRGFSNREPALVVGRNAMMMAMNNFDCVRTLLAEQAMGRKQLFPYIQQLAGFQNAAV